MIIIIIIILLIAISIGILCLYSRAKVKGVNVEDYTGISKEEFDQWKRSQIRGIDLFLLSTWGFLILNTALSLAIYFIPALSIVGLLSKYALPLFAYFGVVISFFIMRKEVNLLDSMNEKSFSNQLSINCQSKSTEELKNLLLTQEQKKYLPQVYHTIEIILAQRA